MYNSKPFSVFTELYSHHHRECQNVITPKKSHAAQASPSMLCPFLQPLATLVYFLPTDLSALNISGNGIRQHVTPCLAFFTHHEVLKVYSCCNMNQYFIPSYGSVIFHLWINHVLLIYSSSDKHSCCSYFLPWWTSASINICIQVSVQMPIFISLEFIPRSEILGTYGNLMLDSYR